MGNIGMESEITREFLEKEYKNACKRIAAFVELNNVKDARIATLESALRWLANRLERPGGASANELVAMAIKHGRTK
jgi:hypothetical protein